MRCPDSYVISTRPRIATPTCRLFGSRDLRIAYSARSGKLSNSLFFYGQEVGVLAHAITKEDQIPRGDLDRAVERKRVFATNPNQHLFEGDVTNG